MKPVVSVHAPVESLEMDMLDTINLHSSHVNMMHLHAIYMPYTKYISESHDLLLVKFCKIVLKRSTDYLIFWATVRDGY